MELSKSRERTIIRTGLVGIVANLLLVAFKAAVGLMANSIALVMDAVNNLTDAMSSIITVVGARLANKRPDREHPYGHGRIEYLTTLAIGALIVYAGINSLIESVRKIIWPGEPDYSAFTVAVIVAAIAVKIMLGRYVGRVGKRIDAKPLIASGKDALFDAVLSAGTLLAAVLSLGWHIDIDGVIGTLISVFILKGGVDILRETADTVIGTRIDPAFAEKLIGYISSFGGVRGVYDLSLSDYGPELERGAVHIEVDDHMTARQIHELTERISTQVYKRFNTVLTVGIYASSTSGDFAEMKHALERVLDEHPEVIQMHAFYVDEKRRLCHFDLVVDFNHDAEETANEIKVTMKGLYPDFTFATVLDPDTGGV